MSYVMTRYWCISNGDHRTKRVIRETTPVRLANKLTVKLLSTQLCYLHY